MMQPGGPGVSCLIDGRDWRSKLPSMLHFRPLVVGGLLLLAACERSRDLPPTDSAAPGGPAPTGESPAPPASGWDASAGPYLLIPGTSPSEAMVIDPEQRGVLAAGTPADSAALAGRAAILLAPGGKRIAARLTVPAPPATDECAAPWPAMRLAADSAIGPWQVGFVEGNAEGVAADSLPSLPVADSSALVAAAARLASALPVRDEAYFRGLPFAVRSLQRFSPAPGVQAFAASLVRRVSQEDSPLEERTFIVAERESPQAPWRVAYQERAAGSEDEVETAESIAPLILGARHRPMLLVVHEVTDGLRYRLLERTGAARWVLRWTSATAKCGG